MTKPLDGFCLAIESIPEGPAVALGPPKPWSQASYVMHRVGKEDGRHHSTLFVRCSCREEHHPREPNGQGFQSKGLNPRPLKSLIA